MQFYVQNHSLVWHSIMEAGSKCKEKAKNVTSLLNLHQIGL